MLSKFTSKEDALAYAFSKMGRKTPIAKTAEIDGLMKSWVEDNGDVGFEGWISTPHRDLEGDIIEPEAFAGEGLTNYMRRGAPVSVEHNTRTIPVGFLMKSMLVRDGKTIQTELNERNPGDFRYADAAVGTGWYARGLVYEDAAKRGVVNGTLSSFSWIGMPKDWKTLVGKGRHFKDRGSINPVIETTITAYPINTTAVMRIAKASGLLPSVSMDDVYQAVLNDPDFAEQLVKMLAPGILPSAADKASQVVRRFTSPDLEKTTYFDYFKGSY